MTQTRRHKIKSDYGIRDYWLNFHKKKINRKITADVYCSVLNDCLDAMTDLVIDKNFTWRLPSGLGRVCISKKTTSVSFRDGKLVTNRPIDWAATTKLWASNPEADKNRTVIYHENFHTDGYVIYMRYSKAGANYKNKGFYKLQFNRQKKRKLAQNILSGNFDTLIEDKFI